MCRWLLLSMDRAGSSELTMTHEMLSMLLGVRREGITEVARRLQGAGLIAYRRGRISVINRAGIESMTCECYRVLRTAFDTVCPKPSRPDERPGQDSAWPAARHPLTGCGQ